MNNNTIIAVVVALGLVLALLVWNSSKDELRLNDSYQLETANNAEGADTLNQGDNLQNDLESLGFVENPDGTFTKTKDALGGEFTVTVGDNGYESEYEGVSAQ